jgi:sulfate transport system permease protein
MGYTLLYLGGIVVLPLALLVFNLFKVSWGDFVEVAFSARAVMAYWVCLKSAFLASVLNVFFGSIVAWVFTRYSFPFKSILDVFIDLPFVLPTAVSGITLATLWAQFGVAYTQAGIVVAMTFIGLPFVVRTVQPVMESLESEVEDAAKSLGATSWQTFMRVVFPSLIPSIVTGFTLAFSRAIGEYGSIIFISGNIPFKTEIPSLLIMSKLEQFDYPGATVIACVMVTISLVLLIGLNSVNKRLSRRFAGGFE